MKKFIWDTSCIRRHDKISCIYWSGKLFYQAIKKKKIQLYSLDVHLELLSCALFITTTNMYTHISAQIQQFGDCVRKVDEPMYCNSGTQNEC